MNNYEKKDYLFHVIKQCEAITFINNKDYYKMHYQSQYQGVTENVRIIRNENGEYILENGYSHRSMVDFRDIQMKEQGYKSISLSELKELAKENKIIGIEVNGEIIPNCIQLSDIANRYRSNTIIKKLLHEGEYNNEDGTLTIKLIHPIIPTEFLK